MVLAARGASARSFSSSLSRDARFRMAQVVPADLATQGPMQDPPGNDTAGLHEGQNRAHGTGGPAAHDSSAADERASRSGLVRVFARRARQLLAPRAQQAFAACLGYCAGDDWADSALWTVAVEAVGSGVVYAPALRIVPGETVGPLRSAVAATWPQQGKVRLFAGHGGPELDVEADATCLDCSAVTNGSVVVVARWHCVCGAHCTCVCMRCDEKLCQSGAETRGTQCMDCDSFFCEGCKSAGGDNCTECGAYTCTQCGGGDNCTECGLYTCTQCGSDGTRCGECDEYICARCSPPRGFSDDDGQGVVLCSDC